MNSKIGIMCGACGFIFVILILLVSQSAGSIYSLLNALNSTAGSLKMKYMHALLMLVRVAVSRASYYYYDDDGDYEEYENLKISAPPGYEYLYERKLAYESGSENEGFGQSVSMNGNRLLVGAYQDPKLGEKAGAAHIFLLDSSELGWVQLCSLVSNSTAPYDYFGWSVSLSNNFALVGAWQNDDVGSNAGAAYFFKKVKDYAIHGKEEWRLHTKVFGWEHDDSFGMAVAIANDQLAVVGAPGGTNGEGDYGSGYVSVFRYVGNVWTESDVLEASDGSGGHFFGMNIAFDAAAKLVVVGAYGHGLYGNDRVGVVYLFNIAHWGSPVEMQMLKAHDATAGDEFGRSVVIYGDTIAISATGDDENGASSGSVYIFQYGYAGGMSTQWVQRVKITPTSDCPYCYFGAQLAMFNDTLMVGLRGGSDVAGAVWMYKRDLEMDSNFHPVFLLNCTDSVAGDQFGSSIFISEKFLVVGAVSSNGFDYETGAVYVYSKRAHYNEDGLGFMLVASVVMVIFAALGAVFSFYYFYGRKNEYERGLNRDIDTSTDSRRGLTDDSTTRL